jgi:AcrR family transcriptional regulator
MSNMQQIETSDKRKLILDAAFKVFLTYGFRRTTMADIADAAGISRPALYLEFKNKADIYRAGFLAMLDRTFRNVDAALDGDAPLCQRLTAALDAGVVAPLRRLQQSPHGAELFEVKQEIAGDLGQDWNAVLEQSLGRALADAAANGEISLERCCVGASDLARLIVSGAEGVKKRMTDWHQAETDINKIIELMVEPLVQKTR